MSGKRKAPAKVSKKPPKLEPFSEYCVKVHYKNSTKQSEMIRHHTETITTLQDKYWDEYYDQVNAKRSKKAKKEPAPYSASKLNKDAQTILTKLEDIKANIANLDKKALHEQMIEVCQRAQEVAEEVAKTPDDVAPATTLPTDPSPIVPDTVAQTEPTVELSNVGTPLTTIPEEHH
jgi:hypothetical protein